MYCTANFSVGNPDIGVGRAPPTSPPGASGLAIFSGAVYGAHWFCRVNQSDQPDVPPSLLARILSQ